MSVIIRLQNLPWTANARDIRNFFTGLSIPEGGVHIIGGEMGDAFIAFSTDEDARCAMLKDREKLMEVQVRLLLSSRAEMQKVIETARNVGAAAATVAATPSTAVAAVAMPPVPQPPMIGSFLGQKQQQVASVLPSAAAAAAAPSFLAYQQQAGITLADVAGLKVERHSPESENFSSRRRHSRSRSHSRTTSSDDSDRSRERDRDRHHNRDRDTRRDARGRKRRPDLRSDSSERELKIQPKSNIMPWATVAPATAATVAAVAGLSNVVPGLQQQLNIMSVLQSVPGLQSYNTSTTSSSTTTTNNYNLNLTAGTQPKQQQILPDLGLSSKPQVTNNSGQDQPIAFANVNPYAQMYPQLFQQQQQLLLQQQAVKTAAGMGNSPNAAGDSLIGGGSAGGAVGSVGVGSAGGNASAGMPIAETCYIKISGMCPTTSYSDLRKYFAGLYIPHNGIKIVSGANGARTGVAYIEFSRVSSAQKALARNNTMFRNRLVQIVPISDEEFDQVDERVQRNRESGGGGGGGGSSGRSDSRSTSGTAASAAPAVLPPISVLYVEDLPQLTTEQDIMKMFSATCTIVDILLTPSPHNRREFVAFVLFARENEARSALDDTARHYIGFRKLRVRASNQTEMQNAKEKMRRANEQLQKEEQQQREDAEREQQQQQLQQQQQQQQQQEQLLALQAKLSSDPRRRNNNEGPQQQQQHQQQQNLHSHNNNNSHNNMPPFANTGMHNGNMPFAFQQQHNSSNNGLNMHNNNNGMHMNNNNNNNGNNMPPFQHHQQQQQQPPRRQEDVFVLVHNCEYATRINDLGEFFSSENLRIEHIEMLFNERNQSAGEFIVEFVDAHNAKLAIREFHNRRFRGRGLRLSPIMPQEIADRMNKPFMDYLPGGNGPRQSDSASQLPPPQQQQHQQQQQQQQQSRRRGPSRFDDASNHHMGQQQPQQQQSLAPPHDSDDSNSSKQQHFNPFAARGVPELNPDAVPATSPMLAPIMNNINNNNNIGGTDVPPSDEGIPDKFNRPGCVVAMRNVPFKADLKDILRFFNDYKLSPDDIIRRFNDEGKPTGDARVAFESQSEARSAFETRRRKQIFNRTVYLDII
ncbi:uncharacterized protein LOC117787303 [Drosophila innubila]|uniref:uncharacterized protein LOC117787303 n=1 Tax=Drosophila innubila TaxID=198719 RepID=UPI00148C3F36|nr:uncharacterized protein LOC117787303 [Drosophila innubila]